MPNWATQRITIEMVDEENSSRASEILQSLLNDEGDFDFNKVTPMPEELNEVESIFRNFPALQYYVNLTIRESPTGEPIDPEFRSKIDIVGEIRHLNLIMNNQEFEELTTSIDPSDRPEYFVIGEKCFNNLIKYGHMNWYTWRNTYWGVKWNAAHTAIIGDHNFNSVIFDTAWAPATPVIDELAEQYPECRIIFDFAEEQVSEMAGHYVYENGERVVQEDYDPSSRECYEMAFELDVADRNDYELIGNTYRYSGE